MHSGTISSLIVDNGTDLSLLFNNTDTSGGGEVPPLGLSTSGSDSAASSGSGSTVDLSSESDAISGERASDGGSGVYSSGSASGGAVNASGDESGDDGAAEKYTALALLQVSAEDGGVQCSHVGQYECIAGVRHQAGSIVNVTVSVAIAGKLIQSSKNS